MELGGSASTVDVIWVGVVIGVTSGVVSGAILGVAYAAIQWVSGWIQNRDQSKAIAQTIDIYRAIINDNPPPSSSTKSAIFENMCKRINERLEYHSPKIPDENRRQLSRMVTPYLQVENPVEPEEIDRFFIELRVFVTWLKLSS
ncbi:MAG: hypothetical protein OXP37_10665 [Chloroflexota bacterium]|nr:hypothetical protein [Chloroflexota bacterium]